MGDDGRRSRDDRHNGKSRRSPRLSAFSLSWRRCSAGYLALDARGSPLNQTITYLSLLHIVFQPFFINAFAMELAPRRPVPAAQAAVFAVCALSSAVMLLQLHPFDWAGSCRSGSALCTLSGDWHIAWSALYNGLTLPPGAGLKDAQRSFDEMIPVLNPPIRNSLNSRWYSILGQ